MPIWIHGDLSLNYSLNLGWLNQAVFHLKNPNLNEVLKHSKPGLARRGLKPCFSPLNSGLDQAWTIGPMSQTLYTRLIKFYFVYVSLSCVVIRTEINTHSTYIRYWPGVITRLPPNAHPKRIFLFDSTGNKRNSTITTVALILVFTIVKRHRAYKRTEHSQTYGLRALLCKWKFVKSDRNFGAR